MKARQLILEDGTVFVGKGFGSDKTSEGEVVFNTGMTGYQEVISDPSYCDQIVTMTYPLIGNYGINRDDFESVSPFIKGLVVKEHTEFPSNFRSEETLDYFLKAHEISGISGIDTRKLTKLLRKHGTMRGRIASVEESPAEITDLLRKTPSRSDQVKKTSTPEPYIVPATGPKIAVIDFGMKHSILRELVTRNCHVTVVPYHYSAEKILHLKPDGILLTNGPGNPKDVPKVIEMIKGIIGKIPLFGICLGHQLFALACGADTEKMKFGHRGANHPVKDLQINKVFMTSQNHSYTVTKESIEQTELFVTQIALNDQTVEGIKHKIYPAFSVQYHPESSPGPEDTVHLFDDFLEMISTVKDQRKKQQYA